MAATTKAFSSTLKSLSRQGDLLPSTEQANASEEADLAASTRMVFEPQKTGSKENVREKRVISLQNLPSIGI
ncbi:uncharacterized protein Z519_12012 [Cladophialophora bantiana CBS 173.52]|uniref:Uncharacterized protein n=1 Tax=Cladophialophora bantiana (strain ATCC 10958 / CBS 173.52 / CDC B-1940 / NIH 8579) TaxID=1442370 RepID=A0A0D2EB63_CLAB1|nr:uncharacterized protein Z519_12012 [Cladophialophora bantiana CBS 173.52]KIW87376.1 hypothetical protein Z519_12012 [Cladophialophora bantiana CBS 173.52]